MAVLYIDISSWLKSREYVSAAGYVRSMLMVGSYIDRYSPASSRLDPENPQSPSSSFLEYADTHVAYNTLESVKRP